MGIRYRTRQFWFALTARPASDDLAQAGHFLSPQLLQIFLQMQPGEQAHSLAVFRRLLDQGETDRDLLAAALLHDVGKSRCRLYLWERVFIVLAHRIAPHWAWRRDQSAPRGPLRSLVVAARHPEWGAQMAQAAGASPCTVELIRRHQDRLQAGEPIASVEAACSPSANHRTGAGTTLLIRLQSVDNER